MKNLAPVASALSGVFLLALTSASSAQAAEIFWSGAAVGSTSWDTAGNWIGGARPADDFITDVAVFNWTSSAGLNQPNLSTTRSVSGIKFGDGSTATAATTIGGIVRIGSNGILKQADSGAATFTSALRLGGSQSWTNNSGTALTIGTSGTTSSVGTHTGIGASTLTLNGSGSGQTVVHDVVANVNGAVSIAVSRTGAGGVTFTNANTYSGGTSISSGTLLVNNTAGSGTGGGAVSVGANGRLGGTGSVSGATTLLAGGAITPGSSGAGTLSGGSLTWNSNDTSAGMFFDLGANQAASDVLTLTGGFNKGIEGSSFIFNFNDLGVTPSLSYTLVNFGSTTFADANVFSAVGVDGTFAFVGNSLTFTTAAIPEPSTAAAFAAGAALLWASGSRRRRA